MLDKERNAVNFENVDIVLEPPCNSYTNEQLNCPFTGKATAAAKDNGAGEVRKGVLETKPNQYTNVHEILQVCTLNPTGVYSKYCRCVH